MTDVVDIIEACKRLEMERDEAVSIIRQFVADCQMATDGYRRAQWFLESRPVPYDGEALFVE